MRSFAGRLEGLEKSQSKFEENLDAEGNKRGGKSKSYDAPMTPTVNSSSDDNFEVIDNRRSTSGSTSLATQYRCPTYSVSSADPAEDRHVELVDCTTPASAHDQNTNDYDQVAAANDRDNATHYRRLLMQQRGLLTLVRIAPRRDVLTRNMIDDEAQSDDEHTDNAIIDLSDSEYEGRIGDPDYDESEIQVVDADWTQRSR
ncbi:hypothetical protein F444_06634 [Phytophthora nicotianae P1976]|uniref:Uncharacterized protein n=1 Tax=Phytophthora nicotianae P1976 TaxID=1317066 RepID=A0A081AHM2_PHYNI|nr:hypothetical protein F444_06634 [Phytophthora nicotianae P1976]